jgi:hypothetical protein
MRTSHTVNFILLCVTLQHLDRSANNASNPSCFNSLMTCVCHVAASAIPLIKFSPTSHPFAKLF